MVITECFLGISSDRGGGIMRDYGLCFSKRQAAIIFKGRGQSLPINKRGALAG